MKSITKEDLKNFTDIMGLPPIEEQSCMCKEGKFSLWCILNIPLREFTSDGKLLLTEEDLKLREAYKQYLALLNYK